MEGGSGLKKRLVCALLCLALLLSSCELDLDGLSALFPVPEASPAPVSFTLEDLPEYSGEASVILGENLPAFSEADKSAAAFERYSPLDSLGRCGPAFAKVGTETMPTGERESIGMIRPSGWQLVKYDFVDGKYLFNRCHLIGWQLTGKNANEENLITGTRYLNVQGMLPYEDQVADYIRETGNHVLYRSTPIFQGSDLVCSGVELEGWSVEDDGAGVCFHVYAYNVQPGVVIDYATGENWAADESSPITSEGSPAMAEAPPEEAPPAGADLLQEDIPAAPSPEETAAPSYVLNTRSMRFHLPGCPGVATMSEKNQKDWYGDRETLLGQGYVPCGTCKP